MFVFILISVVDIILLSCVHITAFTLLEWKSTAVIMKIIVDDVKFNFLWIHYTRDF